MKFMAAALDPKAVLGVLHPFSVQINSYSLRVLFKPFASLHPFTTRRSPLRDLIIGSFISAKHFNPNLQAFHSAGGLKKSPDIDTTDC